MKSKYNIFFSGQPDDDLAHGRKKRKQDIFTDLRVMCMMCHIQGSDSKRV